MEEAKKDYEPAKIYNEAQKDYGLRIGVFTNHLLVLSAGILSITIGAFLGISPPKFVPEALSMLRAGWWLLCTSLVCALFSSFGVLLGQTLVMDQMRAHYVSSETGPLKLFMGPAWLRFSIRALVVISFATCGAGIICICSAASEMLRLP